jgi:GTP cyclohydrolase FolE2
VNPLAAAPLEDVQAQPDARQVAIDQVGISDLRYPIRVAGRDGALQATVATASVTVDLPPDVRGTHMSRLVQALAEDLAVVSPRALGAFVACVRQRLGSTRARLEMTFPYFVDRAAPVSGLAGLVDCDATLVVEAGVATALTIGVRVPITSLCPCSREISDYGAHNQRGHIELEVVCEAGGELWLEDLIDVAEAAASAPIYSLLKRVDERHVTMQAYENPAFVEDIVRDVVVALRSDDRVLGWFVRVTNQESIHTHNAVATVRGRRPE